MQLAYAARILELFRLFPSDGHTQRNAFMKAAIQWTSKFGVSAGGDPALHHVLGEALAAGMRGSALP